MPKGAVSGQAGSKSASTPVPAPFTLELDVVAKPFVGRPEYAPIWKKRDETPDDAWVQATLANAYHAGSLVKTCQKLGYEAQRMKNVVFIRGGAPKGGASSN